MFSDRVRGLGPGPGASTTRAGPHPFVFPRRISSSNLGFGVDSRLARVPTGSMERIAATAAQVGPHEGPAGQVAVGRGLGFGVDGFLARPMEMIVATAGQAGPQDVPAGQVNVGMDSRLARVPTGPRGQVAVDRGLGFPRTRRTLGGLRPLLARARRVQGGRPGPRLPRAAGRSQAGRPSQLGDEVSRMGPRRRGGWGRGALSTPRPKD